MYFVTWRRRGRRRSRPGLTSVDSHFIHWIVPMGLNSRHLVCQRIRWHTIITLPFLLLPYDCHYFTAGLLQQPVQFQMGIWCCLSGYTLLLIFIDSVMYVAETCVHNFIMISDALCRNWGVGWVTIFPSNSHLNPSILSCVRHLLAN